MLWLSLTFHFLKIIQGSVSSITSVCVWLFSLCSVDTSLGKKEKRVNVWSLTQRRLLTSQNKEWKGRLVGTKGKCHLKTEQRAKDISLHPLSHCLTVITGSTKTAVSSAVTRVEVLVESFRRKQPFTHFLSFPLNNSKIQEGFLRFKDEVLKQCSQVSNVKKKPKYDWWQWWAVMAMYCLRRAFYIINKFPVV